MIQIPNTIVPFLSQDLLKTFAKALFVEIEDNRLISLIDPTTIDQRVDLIRNSSIFNQLIEALDLFGEDDVFKLIAPKMVLITDELSLGRPFVESIEDNLKHIG